MITISLMHLKGGVGKTLTAVEMAVILAVKHGYRVLLVNNDKQGDASKLFGLHGYNRPSAADMLTERNPDMDAIILHTGYANLDLVPSNMNLIEADMRVLMDHTRPQHNRYKAALASVAGRYDYCIIDNQPDINMHTINALAASDEVIIPLKLDDYALDGVDELLKQMEYTRQDMNPGLTFRGCLITMYRNDEGNRQGENLLYMKTDLPVFRTRIRYSEKVSPSTFAHMPAFCFSRGCAASVSYVRMVQEYLDGGPEIVPDLGTQGGV